jgi:molybdopterin-binding protein
MAKEVVLKISARNIIKGKITEIHKGATSAHVSLDIGGTTITASITNESVDDLKLTVGQMAYAVIKSTDVMIGVD